MKLNNDKITIESRREIDILQDMIRCYLASSKINGEYREELETIQKQLDVLYISW